MEKKYDNTNSGALFFREAEAGSKRPTLTGRITIGKDVVRQMVDALSAGEECFIELAGWEKVSKADKPYVSVTIKGPEDANAYKNNKGGASASSSRFKKASKEDEIEF